MSEKPKANGHDKGAEIHVTNPATIRSRRFRERKRKGVVILQAEIQPDMTQALVQLGWLHESERRNREALTAAIGALVLRSLSAGVSPSERPLLEIDPEAIQAAWPWAKPGSEPTPETAARAIRTLSACAATVGFSPAEYSARLMRMVEARAH
jgi:hypothetical protein